MNQIKNPGADAITIPREEPACGRCVKCHPGKRYSEAFCRVATCTCHRGNR